MGDDVTTLLPERLTALAAQVRRTDAMVAAGEPEGVHDLRVALRRTRSLLRSFRSLLREDRRAAADRLVEEARWAAGELSPVRDAEVVHERLRLLLEHEPGELVLGAVAARIDDRARQDARDGGRRILELRASARYARLLGDLEAFAAGAPFDEVTEEALRDRLRRDWRRLRRRAEAADGLPPGSAAAALHDTRKAAKRARYCAETLAPALGARAEAMAATAEQVQEALGSHRDSVLARRLLRELGVQAHLDGNNGFTFGRLHALEQVHGEAMLADYARVRPELDLGKLRRWLR